jgi:mevalonate kinase
MVQASAPGKVILLGEHAVVYGRPAIAVPVSQVRATATVEPLPPGSGLTLVALDLGRTARLGEVPLDDPLAAAAYHTLAHLELADLDGLVTVRSTIPIAGGMGSGAAVAAAIVRALVAFVGAELSPAEISSLVLEVEKLHHGTPSGIDNTVVVYEQPVYFIRQKPPQTFAVGAPLSLLIADSGIPSSTRQVVAGVRQRWQADPAHYEAHFDQIGGLVEQARQAIEAGLVAALGALMDRNHALLQEMGVSTAELDGLVDTARRAGACGAKLSGAGGGGSVVALVQPERAAAVQAALEAVAARVIPTTVV